MIYRCTHGGTFYLYCGRPVPHASLEAAFRIASDAARVGSYSSANKSNSPNEPHAAFIRSQPLIM